MQELDDQRLLDDFARRDSETAFVALVGRYINLVYSTAWRFTHNREHAEEITQAVFIILARKAGQLQTGTVLSGWLYQAARLTSANFIRGEIRRRRHEQEAFMQATLDESEAAAAWKDIAPLLDEAMGALNPTDRATVVLRFFENKTAQEIASALNTSQEAAHKRVHRALGKLRLFFSKRGVNSSTTLIAGAISVHSIQPAPPGLAATVALTSAKGAAAGISTVTLVKGVLKLMAWSQAKTGAVAAAAFLVVALGTSVTVEKIHKAANEKWQLGELDVSLFGNPPYHVAVLPSKSYLRKRRIDGMIMGPGDGAACGFNRSIADMMQVAYSQSSSMLPLNRIVFTTPAGTNLYDFITNLRHTPREALQEELKRTLGFAGQMETIETNVLLLRVRSPNDAGIKPVGAPSNLNVQPGRIVGQGQTIANLARALEDSFCKIPVIDQTYLTGQYDFTVVWPVVPKQASEGSSEPTSNLGELKRALIDQLGLELVPGTAPVQMLIVSRSH